MTWGTDRFFEAFARHGMLNGAWLLKQGSSVSVEFSADFRQPSVDMMSDGFRAFDYMIEYRTSDVSKMSVGDQVFIKGKIFSVSKPARSIANGDFSQAELALIAQADANFDPRLTPWQSSSLNPIAGVGAGPL